MTDLANKVIWITGASSGIGKALAQTAAQQATKLILSGRRVEALDALAVPARFNQNYKRHPYDLQVSDVAYR